MVKPEGVVMMNVQIPCVKGYNEDQIAIVMDDPGLKDCPVILGMPTIFQVETCEGAGRYINAFWAPFQGLLPLSHQDVYVL